MWYVGLDAHSKRSSFCVLDENGKQVRAEPIIGPWSKVLEVLATIKKPFAICFEASTGYGVLFERLAKLATRVLVAHPGHLRLIFRSKRKSDRIDAQKLAKLLYLDEVPQVHVPDREVRSWRGLIEYRKKNVGKRTGVKCEIRALLRGLGVEMPARLWTKKNLAWLREQELPTVLDRIRLEDLLDQFAHLTKTLKMVEQELNARAAAHPGVQLLMTIPGVGVRTAEAVIAYIDDPQRFHSTKAIGAYFGIVPCLDESAGKGRYGHITKNGPSTVRALVTEAAWQAIRRSPEVKKRHERIMQGKDERKKLAVVAIGHYLLRVMLAMLKTGEVWREPVARTQQR